MQHVSMLLNKKNGAVLNVRLMIPADDWKSQSHEDVWDQAIPCVKNLQMSKREYRDP
jgi:hypothetical protein